MKELVGSLNTWHPKVHINRWKQNTFRTFCLTDGNGPIPHVHVCVISSKSCSQNSYLPFAKVFFFTNVWNFAKKPLVGNDDHQQGLKVFKLIYLHYHLTNPNVVTTPLSTNFWWLTWVKIIGLMTMTRDGNCNQMFFIYNSWSWHEVFLWKVCKQINNGGLTMIPSWIPI